MKLSRPLLFASGTLLALAGAIYLGARSGLRLHEWAQHAGLGPTAALLRAHVGGAPSWVRYQLPDGLWQLAFGLAMASVWTGAPSSRRRTVCLALPPLLGIGSELAQGLRLIEGVFDRADLMFLCAGAAAGLLAARPRCLASVARGPEGGHLGP